MIIFTKCCCHLYWSYLLSIQIKCYFILWWHEAVISDRCCFYCGPRLATLADTNSAFWAAALVSTHSFPFYWDQSSLSDKQSFSPSFLTLRMFLFLTPSFFPPPAIPWRASCCALSVSSSAFLSNLGLMQSQAVLPGNVMIWILMNLVKKNRNIKQDVSQF